jgi:hypothetical protein
LFRFVESVLLVGARELIASSTIWYSIFNLDDVCATYHESGLLARGENCDALRYRSDNSTHRKTKEGTGSVADQELCLPA